MPTINLDIQVELEKVRSAFAAMDGVSKKSADQMARQFAAGAKKMEKETSGLVAGVAKEAGTLTKLGGLIGGPLGGALQMVGDSSEVASASLSKAALAAGGIGLAVAGVAALGGAVYSVLTDLDSYRETLASLEKKHVISPAQKKAVELASAAISVLAQYAADFAVVVTANVAPAVSNFLKGAVGGFTFLKSFVGKTLSDIGSFLGAVWDVMSSGFSSESIGKMKDAFGEVASVSDDYKSAAVAMLASVRDFEKDTLVERTDAAKAYFDKHKEKEKEAKDTTKERLAAQLAAEKMVLDAQTSVLDAEGKINAARKAELAEYAKVVKESGDKTIDVNAGVAAINAKYDHEVADLRDDLAKKQIEQQKEVASKLADFQGMIREAQLLTASEEEKIFAERDQRIAELLAKSAEIPGQEQAVASARVAIEASTQAQLDELRQEQVEKEADAQDAIKQKREQVAQAALSGTSALVGSISDLYNQLSSDNIDNMREGSAEQKKALKKQFYTQKAISLVQAGINTALAVTSALTMPPPAGYVMAALSAAAGAVQIGLIAAAKPSFHVGGLTKNFAKGPDEVDARLTSSEGVLTSTGVAAVGGEQGLRDLNRGRSQAPQGGGGIVAMVMDGSVVDALWRGPQRGLNGLMARVRSHAAGGLAGRTPARSY